MPRKRLVVVNITLQGPEWDFDEKVTFAGRDFRLIRVGTTGDLDAAEKLVWQWSLKADAVAVTGVREAQASGVFKGDPLEVRQVLETTARVPVRDGSMLADVLQEWAIRRVQAEMPGYFNNARTVVLSGKNYERTIRVLREFTANIDFVDPALRTDVPIALNTNPVVAKAAEVGMWTWRLTPGFFKDHSQGPVEWVSDKLAHRAARDADIIVGSYAELMHFGLEDLAGKTVVTNAVSDGRLAELTSRGVDLIIDATPRPFRFMVVTAMLEAMAAAINTEERELTTDDLLELIQAAELEPRLLRPNGDKRKSRFAFVIHPLSAQYFNNVEAIGALSRVPGMGDVVEKAMAYIPPFIYSHVTGIESPTGAEAEGWLISVGGTPKEMLAHSPEFTYSRLLEAADLARKLGAQVMGLGAFTKVVGDAGVTVAKRAPLPVTTGNSYSASGALWAAHAALRKLGIARVDDHGIIHGKAMVVGATGAIGSVCARLLALVTDELWLVSPETAKLLAIKKDIESENPRAVLHVTARPGDALAEMDLIVTATSAAGNKVLDIMKVKPGCVITDVARPLDMSAEDVAKRPDVLVIESGEIELPGDVHMGNIGLPAGVAYACLAETVVLALEGRYETFTVGRNIEWPKVKEIYQLGLKHGMKLATISGVGGVFTDDDFARVREAALAARATASSDANAT
ncbi:MAG: dehydrogenase [Actinomycetales bacterium]|uniref:Dehydrogenase n=1 Tax=Candidatus Phosphoribacter hodrii TaxID=2953743 RepID=A0A935ILY2_9MICO|nr:dehydrogenase [Candidatus Phosphoribacter hodrii]HOA58627.1 dehydrogenase [Dermatophilaceae bacterium]HPZ70186.1 dehydrogenase [Dermatophilaceae bacterium]HQD02817.1 dehydrogenase [Dermatophilaceae bacterium]